MCCDLLENSYLCGSNNNHEWKDNACYACCDLLENSYLCGSNNNVRLAQVLSLYVVICLKIPTFVVATTTDSRTPRFQSWVVICLKIPTFVVATTTQKITKPDHFTVVICLKIPTFVVATTTVPDATLGRSKL